MRTEVLRVLHIFSTFFWLSRCRTPLSFHEDYLLTAHSKTSKFNVERVLVDGNWSLNARLFFLSIELFSLTYWVLVSTLNTDKEASDGNCSLTVSFLVFFIEPILSVTILTSLQFQCDTYYTIWVIKSVPGLRIRVTKPPTWFSLTQVNLATPLVGGVIFALILPKTDWETVL